MGRDPGTGHAGDDEGGSGPRPRRAQPLWRPGGRRGGNSAIQGRPMARPRRRWFPAVKPGDAPGLRNVREGVPVSPDVLTQPFRFAPRGGGPPRSARRLSSSSDESRSQSRALAEPAGSPPRLSVEGQSRRQPPQVGPAVPRAPLVPPPAQRPWLQPPRRPAGRVPSPASRKAPRSLAGRPLSALIGPSCLGAGTCQPCAWGRRPLRCFPGSGLRLDLKPNSLL